MKKTEKHWQDGLRYYIDRYGNLIEIWQNECGCHPFDVTVGRLDFRGKKVVRCSYSFRNHQQISGFIRRHKWVRLK